MLVSDNTLVRFLECVIISISILYMVIIIIKYIYDYTYNKIYI